MNLMHHVFPLAGDDLPETNQPMTRLVLPHEHAHAFNHTHNHTHIDTHIQARSHTPASTGAALPFLFGQVPA